MNRKEIYQQIGKLYATLASMEVDGGDGLPPTIARQISPAFAALNMKIQPLPPLVRGQTVYLLSEFFTTLNGSWKVSDHVFGVPQWACNKYLKPLTAPDYFDDAGADHHLFASLIVDGQPSIRTSIAYRNDTSIQYATPKARHGWGNIPIWASFNPERGERGAFTWYPADDTPVERLWGGGLPNNQHVSMFAVWQAVKVE